MIRRFGLLIVTLPVAAAVPTGSALAQYYPSPPPPGYYRSAPPPGAYEERLPPVIYQDRLPPPGYSVDDDDDDAVVRRPRRGPQGVQNPQQGPAGAPSRILPYPEEADGALPQPGFVPPNDRPPAYGRQMDQQPPVAAAPPARNYDPNAIRPPSPVGVAPDAAPRPVSPSATSALPPEDRPEEGQPKELAPNLKKQLVNYSTREPAGTIIIDTPNTYLYLVLGNGQAIRYGIGVGREGFTWAGTERISKMSEWPDWHPPAEMIDRQPYLPRFMAGGPGNPLGARALYLGKTLYRVHGTNQPSTIGQTVSSGCIRLVNEDIEDLFSRVQVGTRVVVMPGHPPANTVANSGNPPALEPANPMAPPARSGAAISGSQLPPPR
jgi:lipoprotein-anchoring transpeptidase ErfK/SrfK